MFLSCHVRVWGWIHTQYLPEWKGTPCSKLTQNLKLNSPQLNSSPQSHNWYRNTQNFSQTSQMIELFCKYLYALCIWVYVPVICRRHFRVNSSSILSWMLPEYQGTHCWKQAPNLKFQWLQLSQNAQPLSSKTNTQPFSQTGQIIEL